MLKNYLTIAWRHFWKDRQFTLLNWIGLASGIACAFLIGLWVNDEMQIDKFHQQDSQLYQVMQNVSLDNGSLMTIENTPDLLADALKQRMPEVLDAAIVKTPDPDGNPMGIISNGDQSPKGKDQNPNTKIQSLKAKELYVTPNFFDLFSFRLLQGKKGQVLAGRTNVLLSDQLALKLFHTTQDLIGKTITWDRGPGQTGTVNGLYTISGIFETPPAHSSLQFDLLFPHAVYADNNKNNINWNSSNPATYVLLKKGTDLAAFNNKIKDFVKTQFPAGSDGQKWAGTLLAQRYSDRYLYSRYVNGAPAGGRIEYVKLFSVIALFILVIACVNFMNLSTAKASARMKEVGIKKVMGATRSSLIGQYLSESMLMTLLSLALAIVLVGLLLPAFRTLTGKALIIHPDASLIFILTAITLVTGLLSGSYPALYLSGFKPIAVLKGRLNASAGESGLRKALVVFQFTISTLLIVSVIVVYKQISLIQTKDLGYNKNDIVRFSNEGRLEQDEQTFLSEARTIPGVINASDMEGDMFGNHSGGGGIDWPGKTERIEFSGLYADYDFMETMGLQLKEGHPFSRRFGADSNGVIFNESAIAAMHLKDPIGKTVSLWGRKQQIIGIVKDFHYESLYNRIGPFFLSFRRNTANLLVKIQAGKEKATLAQLELLYKKYNPGLPFEYNFLDEDYKALYVSEQRVALLSRYFAGLAILISCLGLFGLAAFTATRCTREIGIRKVIGASVSDIVTLLSANFLKLVVIAIAIAFPLAWLALHQWLRSFVYRIELEGWMFALAGLSIIGMAILTVSYQSIRSAVSNPADSLRTE